MKEKVSVRCDDPVYRLDPNCFGGRGEEIDELIDFAVLALEERFNMNLKTRVTVAVQDLEYQGPSRAVKLKCLLEYGYQRLGMTGDTKYYTLVLEVAEGDWGWGDEPVSFRVFTEYMSEMPRLYPQGIHFPGWEDAFLYALGRALIRVAQDRYPRWVEGKSEDELELQQHEEATRLVEKYRADEVVKPTGELDRFSLILLPKE